MRLVNLAFGKCYDFLMGAVSQELFADTTLVLVLVMLPGSPMKHEPTSLCSKLARMFVGT